VVEILFSSETTWLSKGSVPTDFLVTRTFGVRFSYRALRRVKNSSLLNKKYEKRINEIIENKENESIFTIIVFNNYNDLIRVCG